MRVGFGRCERVWPQGSGRSGLMFIARLLIVGCGGYNFWGSVGVALSLETTEQHRNTEKQRKTRKEPVNY